MPTQNPHVEALGKKITDVSNALAMLGKGTDLKELVHIIHGPGWTTPAELAFAATILEEIQAHASAIGRLNSQLIAGSKLVDVKELVGR
jgi:hypothetical protein